MTTAGARALAVANFSMATAPLPKLSDVRKRPGMWVGSTGSQGIMHLALEVLGNAIDLAIQGNATSVAVSCHADGSIEICDDGPGLDLSDDAVIAFVEKARNTATADGHTPHIHLTTVGLGLWVVNALSERLLIDSTHSKGRAVHQWRNGGAHHEVRHRDSPDPAVPTKTEVARSPDERRSYRTTWDPRLRTRSSGSNSPIPLGCLGRLRRCTSR